MSDDTPDILEDGVRCLSLQANSEQESCSSFLMTGLCDNGSNCPFAHPHSNLQEPESSAKIVSAISAGPITEEEIKDALLQRTPITTLDIVSRFKARLKTNQARTSFALLMKRIVKVRSTSEGRCLMLKANGQKPSAKAPVTEEKIQGQKPSAKASVTEEEITAFLLQQRSLITARELVLRFWSRLNTKQDKAAFSLILKRITKHKRTSEGCFLVLRTK
ncbi:hypothetical protein GIB67_026924 [Kingdonia uniflora]|uniref:Transcription initiation factor IIF subunit alpha n=1 Tax=Kingdonia uniflora TaxID=39325 RepID=A0A7J7P1A6_9MAGN|nr:hypothetical protein GIB67_026924 [Kingdonia uniflora]